MYSIFLKLEYKRNFIVAYCTYYKVYQLPYFSTDSLQTSTLWAHISPIHRSFSIPINYRSRSSTMSTSEEPQYTSTNEKGEVQIEEDGYITLDNINEMQFKFGTPADITESVTKKNDKSNKKTVSYTARGRSGYAPLTCVYPDGTESSKIFLMNCIIQYTEALTKPDYTYAKNFVFIGVPEEYMNKIFSDALQESGMNVSVKSNVQNLNGHYWMRCSLEKLTVKNTNIILSVNENGEPQTVNYPIDQLLKDFKSNIRAHVLFTFSASINNNDMTKELDFESGQFTATMKPTEVMAIEESDVKGPTLDDTNSRRNESVAWTGHMFAGGKLAELAQKKLKISGRK